MLGEKAPFRTTVFGRRNFFTDKKTFGEDGLNMKVLFIYFLYLIYNLFCFLFFFFQFTFILFYSILK